ncbi:hypothetical protein MOP44_15205 [Occallatibacter riparius]|uniref:Uncharacterized protein n=1 Tax=Occallatibacter riparius TaxID=1002689 RepID=A0A9J7BFZ0_9BACT|nr:hypothetical protein [Occallatibacter riparius]UWZ81924.1 hypothetical protein MOP44_15205 [Occallatibacter riparius]
MGEIEMLKGTAAVTSAAADAVNPPRVAEMDVDPTPIAVASPTELISRIEALPPLHLAALVTFFEVPSLIAALTVSRCVSPLGKESEIGEIEMLKGTAALTSAPADAVNSPRVAEMDVEPIPTPWASPAELISRIEALPLFHFAALVSSLEVPSVRAAFSVSRRVSPLANESDMGEIEILEGTAAVTSTAADAVSPAIAAETEVDPMPTVLRRPVELIAIMAVLPLLHFAVLVSSFEVPSLRTALTVSCRVSPLARESGLGEIEMLKGLAAVTSTVADAVSPLRIAETDVDPTPTALASPIELISRIEVLPLLHLAAPVSSFEVPSLRAAVTVIWFVSPLGKESGLGEIEILKGTAAVTFTVADALNPLRVAEMDVVPTPTALTTPAGWICRIESLPLLHFAAAVSSFELPSL